MDSNDDMKSNEQLPRGTPELQFSSPFGDPNSLPFLSYANQPNGSLTPSLSGFNPGFHSQHAGDLHTPMGLSMVNSCPQMAAPMDPNAMGLNQFGQQFFSQPFQNPQSFAQQPSFAPSAFVHRDSGIDPMDESVDNSSLNELDLLGNPSSKLQTSTVDSPEQTDTQTHTDQK